MKNCIKLKGKNLFCLKLLICFLLFFIPKTGSGQACKDFHKGDDCYVYVPPDRDFKIFNQAKSLQVEIQKPVVYKIVLYGGKDYIVGACAEAVFYRKIRLRIIDGITRKVLFDNKDQDYIESFGFTVNKTQPLDMEVTVLSNEKLAANSKVCVGFQILYSEHIDSK
jgi:hypothetical protein